jgi:hypothetical protein
MSFIKAAIIIGLLGDLTIQIIVKNSDEINKFGLKTYFDKHGSIESLFIAAGMTSTFAMIYQYLDPKLNSILMIAYGAALDILFRYYRKDYFKSLDDYYNIEPYYYTIPWAIIPLFMIKFLSEYL